MPSIDHGDTSFVTETTAALDPPAGPKITKHPFCSASPQWVAYQPGIRVLIPCFEGFLGLRVVHMTNSQLVPKAEILNLQQCWRLLGQTTIGRLALTTGNGPDIFPVNYKVDHETLIFRTGNGTKFTALLAADHIALEADAVSAEFGMAWSVVVKGRAVAVDDANTTLDVISQALFPWQGVKKEHFVRIVPEKVTGRRFARTPSMSWRTPLGDAIRAGLE